MAGEAGQELKEGAAGDAGDVQVLGHEALNGAGLGQPRGAGDTCSGERGAVGGWGRGWGRSAWWQQRRLGLTWLPGLQREALVRVQAQCLTELLDVAGRVLGLYQHHVAGHKAVGDTQDSGGLQRKETSGQGGRGGRSLVPPPWLPSLFSSPLSARCGRGPAEPQTTVPTAAAVPPTGPQDQPSPDPRARDVELNQPNILEV